MQLFIPGCSSPATNLDVCFISFSNLLSHAIGLEYVQPFDQEIPPGVLDNPYIATNPPNITIGGSGETLTVAWPADHLGWILQIKTNSLSAGQWVNLPDTADFISAPIHIDPDISAAFYRLSRP
jgi:hypothetical protein